MRLIPASRHTSTCRRASTSPVDPTSVNSPVPPNVIVPMVSTDTRRPDPPRVRYSTRATLSSGLGPAPGQGTRAPPSTERARGAERVLRVPPVDQGFLAPPTLPEPHGRRRRDRCPDHTARHLRDH